MAAQGRIMRSATAKPNRRTCVDNRIKTISAMKKKEMEKKKAAQKKNAAQRKRIQKKKTESPIEIIEAIREEEVDRLLDLEPSARSAEENGILGAYLRHHARASGAAHTRNETLKWIPTAGRAGPPMEVDRWQPQSKIVGTVRETTIKYFQERAKMVRAADADAFIAAELRFRERIETDEQLVGLERSFQLLMSKKTLERVGKDIKMVMDEKEKLMKELLEMKTWTTDRENATINEEKLRRKEESVGTNKFKKMMEKVETLDQEKMDLKEELDGTHYELAVDGRYHPPTKRILIEKNLGDRRDHAIAVFSDVEGEKARSVDIAASLLYSYRTRNTISENIEQMEIGQASSIKCHCRSANPVIPCWQNPDCPCSRVAKALLKGGSKKLVSPLERNEPGDINWYESMDFSCSEECGCHGNCDNNAFLVVDKKVFDLEVFRREIVGNSVRTMNAISAGTSVFEFVGELNKLEDMEASDNDFAYTVLHSTEDITKKLNERLMDCPAAGWNAETSKQLDDLLEDGNWVINPKMHGNVARTCLHSCDANLVPIRVFQKGFLPANVRMLLVAKVDIFPGTELTLDYGPDYINENLDCACACKSLPCEDNSLTIVNKTSELEKFVQLRHCNAFRRFKNEVFDEANKANL